MKFYVRVNEEFWVGGAVQGVDALVVTKKIIKFADERAVAVSRHFFIRAVKAFRYSTINRNACPGKQN